MIAEAAIVEQLDIPDIFQRVPEVPKALPLATAKWKIGNPEVYHAPVGFSRNPVNPVHSRGNEAYYSYDGGWKDGKMHGAGKHHCTKIPMRIRTRLLI
jgi:hypothetical protein